MINVKKNVPPSTQSYIQRIKELEDENDQLKKSAFEAQHKLLQKSSIAITKKKDDSVNLENRNMTSLANDSSHKRIVPTKNSYLKKGGQSQNYLLPKIRNQTNENSYQDFLDSNVTGGGNPSQKNENLSVKIRAKSNEPIAINSSLKPDVYSIGGQGPTTKICGNRGSTSSRNARKYISSMENQMKVDRRHTENSSQNSNKLGQRSTNNNSNTIIFTNSSAQHSLQNTSSTQPFKNRLINNGIEENNHTVIQENLLEEKHEIIKPVILANSGPSNHPAITKHSTTYNRTNSINILDKSTTNIVNMGNNISKLNLQNLTSKFPKTPMSTTPKPQALLDLNAKLKTKQLNFEESSQKQNKNLEGSNLYQSDISNLGGNSITINNTNPKILNSVKTMNPSTKKSQENPYQHRKIHTTVHTNKTFTQVKKNYVAEEVAALKTEDLEFNTFDSRQESSPLNFNNIFKKKKKTEQLQEQIESLVILNHSCGQEPRNITTNLADFGDKTERLKDSKTYQKIKPVPPLRYHGKNFLHKMLNDDQSGQYLFKYSSNKRHNSRLQRNIDEIKTDRGTYSTKK